MLKKLIRPILEAIELEVEYLKYYKGDFAEYSIEDARQMIGASTILFIIYNMLGEEDKVEELKEDNENWLEYSVKKES